MKFSKPSTVMQPFEKWSIGKKIFLGNLLFLITPLLLIFAFILHYTFTRLDTNIENGLQAAGSSVANMIEMSIDASLYNYLQTLKIDKQFVDDLQENSGIVATIIAISQQMHLNVVAEGVETEEQLLSLGAMGCHEAQGYYFSRAVSGDAILQYLLSERAPS